MKYDEFEISRIEEIPVCEWGKQDKNKYDSLLIVPMPKLHDSGWRCMCFLFCKDEEIVCRSYGGSDVLHIDGIGGYGDWYPGTVPSLIKPKGWKIDCTPSGYLRLFCKEKIKNNSVGCSDYKIYGITEK